MTTSGVTSYSLPASDVINAALRKCGLFAKGQSADTEDLTYGLQALNLALAEMRTLGLSLWKRTDAIIPLSSGVATYTLAQPGKPKEILQSYLVDNTSKSVIPIDQIPKIEYNLLPKSNTGTPVKMTYTPGITSGVVTVWPAPSATTVATKTLHVEYTSEIQIVTSLTETLDFPTEWYNAIVYQLAVLLAPEYAVPLEDRRMLQQEAAQHLSAANSSDQEMASFYIQPGYH